MARMIRVCFVCLGNICRSPTAEGVMQHLIGEAGLQELIEVDSAGTAAYHSGEKADLRSRQEASRRGIELTSLARKFRRSDFAHFDYVMAMDQSNYDDLSTLMNSADDAERLFLLRSFDSASPVGASVPDPYYGGPEGFAEVFEICEAACRGLLAHLRSAHQLPGGRVG